MIARCVSRFAAMRPIKGPAVQADNHNLRLGGLLLEGELPDLPNLIFFPEVFDHPSNWVSFFSRQGVLKRRNVYLLNMRNIGNSDRNSDMNYLTMAEDVARFMYEHKLSTATLAGHGMGAKLALAYCCLHPERTTGFFGLDSSPMDQRYHESFRELAGYVQLLSRMPLNSVSWCRAFIGQAVKCPKWRQLFASRVVEGKDGAEWDFNMAALLKGLTGHQNDNLGNWPMLAGLYGGRSMFTFPEYSRWVYLNTNTLPMYKVCLQLKKYRTDVFTLQGDENPLNHWMYEQEDQATSLAFKVNQFLDCYDGVHVLLSSRAEVGKFAIPDRPHSRDNPSHVYEDYIPAHYHHNWRFTDVYSKK